MSEERDRTSFRFKPQGVVYQIIVQTQNDYKKKHKRYLALPRAVSLIITSHRVYGDKMKQIREMAKGKRVIDPQELLDLLPPE